MVAKNGNTVKNVNTMIKKERLCVFNVLEENSMRPFVLSVVILPCKGLGHYEGKNDGSICNHLETQK